MTLTRIFHFLENQKVLIQSCVHTEKKHGKECSIYQFMISNNNQHIQFNFRKSLLSTRSLFSDRTDVCYIDMADYFYILYTP